MLRGALTRSGFSAGPIFSLPLNKGITFGSDPAMISDPDVIIWLMMAASAGQIVPILIAVMAWAFSTCLSLKGLTKIFPMDFQTALGLGAAFGVLTYFVIRPVIRRRVALISNDKAGVNRLFIMPLIFAAALLSFAHGANDVANAVGPLAAINDAIFQGSISSKSAIPIWVMMVGAIGIAIGLALYGPKLIRTVGTEITELDQMRAFCIALSAASTVIIATNLGC